MPILLEMRDISKDFPGVRALDHVSLALEGGEVHALVGENGAGKSTLIKILSGAYPADSGEIWLQGKRVSYSTPLEALRLGIGAIYQEFNLVPRLSVAENIMLGQVPHRWGTIDRAAMHRQAADTVRQLGVEIDTHLPVSELNVAQQQIVEIAKALARDLRIVIMDEPTAALNKPEVERLFEIISLLKSRGVTILYISHRLGEIFEIAGRVTVLKDGQLVGTKAISAVDRGTLVRMMIGREVADIYPERGKPGHEPVLSVQGLSLGNRLRDVSLELHRGEILAVAGLEGQGQRELARAIAGALHPERGEIYRRGRRARIASPLDAIRAGIAYVPEDRKAEGVVLIRSVGENVALPSLQERAQSALFVDGKREQDFVRRLIAAMDVRLASPAQEVRGLSGGNQQKIVLAKWLGTEPEVLIVAEPTRGVDVGSKGEIHRIMRDLADRGVGILMVSSELPETLGVSDRIVVMAGGRIVAEMPGQGATEAAVMAAATAEVAAEDSAC